MIYSLTNYCMNFRLTFASLRFKRNMRLENSYFLTVMSDYYSLGICKLKDLQKKKRMHVSMSKFVKHPKQV